MNVPVWPTVLHLTPTCQAVTVSRKLILYFSYLTCVAFSLNGQMVISQNIWSATTGRHLTLIGGHVHPVRYPYKEFRRRLERAVREGKGVAK